MNRHNVAVTGSIAFDFISQYPRPFNEVLIPEKLHELSVCFVVDRKERFWGGTAGNIAYNLSLLKESPIMIGIAGNDFEPYRHHLKDCQINTDCVVEIRERPTARANILTDPRGNQISEFYLGALYGADFIDATIPFQDSELVIIAPEGIDQIKKHIEVAKSVKARYFFDPGQNIHMFTADEIQWALEGSAGLFVNAYEYELLLEVSKLDEEAILGLTSLIVKTRGEKGSKLTYRDTQGIIHSIEVACAPVEEVLDPTGCGDAYRAGFLKGLLMGKTLETCAQMGSTLAAYNIECTGTQNHAPSWEDFVSRLKASFDTEL